MKNVILVILTAMLFWACSFSIVQAQYNLGDGRALDANLQQGTGGVNRRAPAPAYNAGNYIITGNVPGLGYFHGDVGYQAPREFRGSLSDDSLFRFRARSVSNTSFGGYSAGQTNQGRVNVFRSFTSTPSGSSRLGSSMINRGSGLVVTPQQSNGQLNSENRRLMDTTFHERGGSLRTRMDGRLLEFKASPLFGLRRQSINQTDQDSENATNESEYGLVPHQPGRYEKANQPGSLHRDQQLEGRINQLPLGHVPPSVESSKNIENPNRLIPLDPKINAEQQKNTENNKAYWELLAQIKVDQDRYETVKQDQKPDDRDVIADITDSMPQGETPIDESGVAVNGVNIQSNDQVIEDLELENPLHRLIKTLNQNLPRVATLGDSKSERINQLAIEGQEYISSGRYFDAQEYFSRILNLEPNNPKALVGLIHSQLGAGMFLTAHFNLRHLFEHHPESIPTRYQKHLLPDAKRIEWIKSELLKLTNLTKQAEPAILLAYLAYQTESTDMIEHSLDIASEFQHGDKLVFTLREVWLERNPEKVSP